MQLTLADEVYVRRVLPTPADARALREAAGISQDTIARAVGVARITVSRWESGERRPRGDHLVRYSSALDIIRGGLLDRRLTRDVSDALSA